MKRVLIPPPRLTRSFSDEEISEAIKKDRLLTLSLKLPVGCNLKCRYCYSELKKGELGFGEIMGILGQAAELGVKSLSIIGEGEPFLYKDKKSGKGLFELILEANRKGMDVIVFTNNTLIDKRKAMLLKRLKVTVVSKLNSPDPVIQDRLSGVKGSYFRITRGLRELQKAGFNKKKDSRLSVHTVICRNNIKDIPGMWRSWRGQGIIPYVQAYVPPSNANGKYVRQLSVPRGRLKELFEELSAIDRGFGFDWSAADTYPIASLGCSVIKTGCCVNSNAQVQVCGYLDEVLGDLRRDSLKDIVSSAAFRRIRRHDYAKGTGCPRHFYGCRAMAFNLKRDRFAKDPYFWR